MTEKSYGRERLSERTIQMFSGMALALMFGASAMLFLNVSFFLALLDYMTRLHAALTVTCACIVLAALAVLFAQRSYHRGKAELTAAIKTSAMLTVGPPAARLGARHLRVVGILAAGALALAAARGRKTG